MGYEMTRATGFGDALISTASLDIYLLIEKLIRAFFFLFFGGLCCGEDCVCVFCCEVFFFQRFLTFARLFCVGNRCIIFKSIECIPYTTCNIYEVNFSLAVHPVVNCHF